MKIAVVSPHARNNGNTTLAMLLGLEFASQNKLTCITHLKPTSKSFQTYLNFKPFNDKTSTPSQIVKILKTGSLSADDVRAYCKQVNNNLEVFTNEYDNFDQEDMVFMLKYMAKLFPHENIIFDVDEDEDIEKVKLVVRLSDVIVINATSSIKELSTFKDRGKEIIVAVGYKPCVVVVNKFNSSEASLKEVASWMGFKKPNNFTVLHYNPWIAWGTNHGKLNILFNNIAKKDSRVIEISSDLTKICSTIAKAKAASDKDRNRPYK